MPKTDSSQISSEKPFIVTHTPLVLVGIGLVLLALFGSLWWTKVHDSPRNVFADMLANNLSTASVTRSSSSTGQQGFERVEQLSFTPTATTRSYVKVSQESEQGKTTVKTETIGTITNDYSRYLNIDVAPSGGQAAPNYRSVENIWAKSSLVEGQPQYLSQSMQGLIPFANLNASKRQEIIKLIQDKKIYKVNYASSKPKRLNGKSAIDFSVSVDPVQYIELLKALNKAVGVDVQGLNSDEYKGQPPISLSVVVDKLSRHVLQVTYGQQKEVFSAYGLTQPITIPEQTVSVQELQQKIQMAQ